jgi:hypothetical protein
MVAVADHRSQRDSGHARIPRHYDDTAGYQSCPVRPFAARNLYIGTWLPEPVDTSDDPHLGAERGEALEFAVLLLLEKLSPTERAAYVLREAALRDELSVRDAR